MRGGILLGSEVTGSLIVQFIGYTQVSLGLLVSVA
jgi:hypothetical protein